MKKRLSSVVGLAFLSCAAFVSAETTSGVALRNPPAFRTMSTGIILVLISWVVWFLIDPPLRPEGLSWPRLILWLFTPLGIYVFLAKHKNPPVAAEPPVGKEGIVAQLSPLEVEVFGSFWSARCAGPANLRLGDRIRVVKRDGLTLVVEPHR
jgi:membrane protein implicated in regulation of membrane protease activity